MCTVSARDQSDPLCNLALQTIYRAVIVSKLFYASSVWWGFSTAADRQRMSAFLCRGVRSGVTMGWLLRLVTGAPNGKGAPDSSKFLMINF